MSKQLNLTDAIDHAAVAARKHGVKMLVDITEVGTPNERHFITAEPFVPLVQYCDVRPTADLEPASPLARAMDKVNERFTALAEDMKSTKFEVGDTAYIPVVIRKIGSKIEGVTSLGGGFDKTHIILPADLFISAKDPRFL